MDNKTWKSRFDEGCSALGIDVGEVGAQALRTFSEELLRWNQKINLTAITDPEEVLEKHLLDSLALGRALSGTGSLLDLGAGAGLPGIPVGVLFPALQVTLVDAVAKKVGFIKHATALLGLAPRVRGVHVNLRGDPVQEKLLPADAVVSRAFMDVPKLLAFARPYAKPSGRVLAMVSQAQAEGSDAAAQASHMALEQRWDFTLPFSRAPRVILSFRPV